MKACEGCKSYNNGRGGNACTRCPEIKQLNILPKAKPCVDYVKIPREILESLSVEESINIYSVLSTHESLFIFCRFTLNLTLIETIKQLNIGKSTGTRLNKSSLMKIRAYVLNRN